MSAGLTPVGVQVQDKVVYTAGSWVPGTTGTFPNNWAHGGLAYDKASVEKAVMVLWAPASWPSVTVSLLCLAATFQSGNVVFRLGDEGGSNDVTVTVSGGVYHSAPVFPTPLSWSPGFGPTAGLQFVQFPLSRAGDAVADTLDDDLAVLSVILQNGG